MFDRAIVFEQVSKPFGHKQVLEEVTFSVPTGSIVGLLGKNGVGKTTLMKCGLGLLKPKKGKITLLGENPWNLSEEKKERLGYVPQTPHFYPWLTVEEVIGYTLSFYEKWNTTLINQLLEEWELDPKDNVKNLSEGTKQKLSLLLAMGHEPELMVLDEPLASLDPASRRDFLRRILTISTERELTVLLSTHITSDLERVADTVVILGKKQVLFSGELSELKDTIKCLRVKSQKTLPLEISMAGLLRMEQDGQRARLYLTSFSDGKKEEVEQILQGTAEVEDIFLELTR